MKTLTKDAKAEARRAVDAADDTVARLKGELIAAVKSRQKELPSRLTLYVIRLEAAEAEAARARVALAAAPPTALDPDAAAERTRSTRLSALVAAHVVGLELVASDSPFYPWRVRTTSGRLLEVPNFAGDVSAVANAEACLILDAHRERYRQYMEQTLGADQWAIATASPFVRSRALLYALAIDPAEDPPITET